MSTNGTLLNEKISERILNSKLDFLTLSLDGATEESYDKIRPGVTSHLTREETETSLSQAIYRWSTRKKTADKIGTPIFALAKYEKIYRITIPIGGAGLILITTELDVNVNEIVDKTLEIRNEYVKNL